MEHEEQQDIVLSRFCALYLPATVSRFLDPPPLRGVPIDAKADLSFHNAYLEMLVQIQHNPYFAKYLRSQKPIAADGKQLPRVLAERLLEHAPRLDRLMLARPTNRPTLYYESVATSSVQLLSTLLVMFVKVKDQETILPALTRQGLLPWLHKWSHRYANKDADTPLGSISLRALAQISSKIDIRADAKQVRRKIKNWDVCAIPSCEKKTNNQACSR